ncbi:FecCD family ABC transporter permease [Paenibacillus sp. TY11]|uniref:FecCD family ABC transporter permease n=1 Tax=Paenibacillus sp. TY11 TaxID=3448633 RepID=UPI004039B3C0
MSKRNKRIAVFVILIVVFLIFVLLSTGIGTLYIPPLHVLSILAGGGETMEATVVLNLRLPRLMLAALVGAALALSGTVLQAVIRNPLASPEIIGVNSGASMMAVLFLALFNETLGIVWLPLFAFCGAAGVALIIYTAAWKKGVSPMRIILIGFGVTALLEAWKTLFLIFGPIWRTSQAQVWMTGTVYGTTFNEVYSFLPWLIIFIPVLFLLMRSLDIQLLGDELPIGLGSRVQLLRFALIFISAGLAGAATAFAGGIGFIGLMAPHISRRLVGGSHRSLLWCSALIGAILLVAADFAGRTLFPPRDIPAGVFTAVIGAPFFLYLLIQVRRRA